MIKLKNISFAYNSKQLILDDVSLTLESNQVLGLVGPSGGGKSTLLRIIAGLESPNQGCITINDREIVSDGTFVKAEHRNIGMVFQDYALFPHMTVKKNILYGLSHMNKSEKLKRLDEVLALIEMTEYQNRYPHQLSGGQQQRVALARAIAPRPKVLLLDEPFSNLDHDLIEHVRKELFSLIKNIGITTIIVTHNIEDVANQTDQIIRIESGKCITC